MNLLVTGGAGFIGSNFIPFMLKKYPDYYIVNLDLLTYAGNINNLSEIENHPNYKFVKGDIRDRELLDQLFLKYKFNGVIHFAAESHVDNSILNPGLFVETNVNGTFALLDVAKKFWLKQSGVTNNEFENARFHHISTDEVYGTLEKEGFFTEQSSYAPNSPYSASKAASDMLVRSYFHTYGLNVVTTNCSNNFGPKQHNEKFIPTIIQNALKGQNIPVYGEGLNIRDWLFVEDHCKAIDLVFHNGSPGETYLIGGRNEKTNLELITDICAILDEDYPGKLQEFGLNSFKDLVKHVNDRAGHDFRYAIDDTKIRTQLNFGVDQNYYQNLRTTIKFYTK